MIKGWRGLLLTVLVAAAFGFLGARLGMLQHSQAGPGPSPATVRQSVSALLNREFKLTAQQKQRIGAIDQDFTRKHNLIWADIRASNAELAAAVADNMALNTEAQNAILDIQASVGRLHTESILYILAVRKELTPEQRVVFDEHVIMALMRDPA